MNSGKLLFIICIVYIFLLISPVSAAWANSSYSNAKNITLLGADTELTNYPYLVTVEKESVMQSDFDDLIFYDQPVYSGGNLIDFEIETYNATSVTVWLNITTLPGAWKTISVYYGNSSVSSLENSNATWNSDYVGVWHMSDDTVTYAWNNYKDSDGVITANASQYYILAEPSIYYEDNKFKAWIRERFASGVDYLGYWESTDGYDWNEIATDLMGSDGTAANRCRHPYVMQDPNSSGYWLYNYNISTNKEDLWYGTNETNWSIDTYGIFSASDVGGASHIGNVYVWRENTSDWYAIVENNGPTWTSDYATSNDGKSWTFHGQVTVSGFGSNSLSGPDIHKNNGTYYMWFHGNKGVEGGIPSDIYVATCTDRQSWVYQSGFEISREQDWEGAGQSGGQCGDAHFVEYNEELYIFYQGGRTQAPDITWPLRIGLAHLNESLQEVCDHIDAGNTAALAADSTTNTRDGTLTDIDSSTNGVIGSCMEFDGDSSYIDLGTVLNLPTGTHSFWFNTTSIDAGNNQAYADNNAAGGTPIIHTRIKDISGDKVDVNLGGVLFAYGTTSANTWYKVDIISNSSGNDVFYLDGYEVDNKAHDSAHAGDVSGWVFGANRYKNTNWYVGKIDEGQVSDVVRSADWVNLSYQMVVNSSYVTFGAEESDSVSAETIIVVIL